MGFLDFFRQPDINQGVEQYRAASGAVLLDVRTPQEYREGHVPESVNLPLHGIHDAGEILQDRSAPLYVYCYSGARSRQAVNHLRQMGYSNVHNIGGIAAYSGKVER